MSAIKRLIWLSIFAVLLIPLVSATTVSISDVNAQSGCTVTVPLRINATEDIGGCEINITYNSSIVIVSGITSENMDLLAENINNADGWVYINAINISGNSGSAIPVYINFTAVGENGEISPLNITYAALISIDYNPVSCNPSNGSFSIIGTVVSIDDITASQDEIITAPIMVNNVNDLGSGLITITYDPVVVHVIDVTSGNGNALVVQQWNADNTAGSVHIIAWDANTPHSGNVIFANVTYQAVGNDQTSTPLNITVTDLLDYYTYTQIIHTVNNGTFSIHTLSGISFVNADPAVILNDNGRARVPGTNISRLNASVVDSSSSILEVTVDLSVIGGSSAQPMEHISGTDIWTTTTTATTGINLTHELTITATNTDGSSNTAIVSLTVLRRGDVIRDNKINSADAFYIAKYLVDKEPMPSLLVGDTAPAEGDGCITSGDALYIAKYLVKKEVEP